ncbi:MULTISPECIES: globin-coupled sensor protein [Desulfitobacterium]|uniref:Methyl-accepting chemotaxis protein n=1 Tax=Desulfitobacterium dehalogenans (strain ATCC 51507 / DSM 9161 / JW/IU-DC1) TaxID=756499 RepID=I4ADK4_DESDJ|nr:MULTISPECIES: globin-coupled sensor protein [Desulfitobacterium]AFM02039.1 methyl-accepting chemotaxis protein [Desulfitobacterium dehalogenans ATCC 51507]
MINLHQFDLNESIKLLKLEQDQLQLLREFKPIMEQDVDQIVEQFYAHITKIPQLNGIINEFSTVERLRGLQRNYLLSIFPDTVDEEYIMSRVRIGNVHKRINLPPFVYLSSYQTFFDLILPRIFAHYRKKPDQALRLSLAILRIFSFDQQVVMASYIQSYIADIDKKEELEKAYEEIDLLQRRVSEASQALAATSEQTAASAAQMHEATEQISQNAGDAADFSRKVDSLAEEGAQKIQQISERILGLAGMSEKMQEKMSELDRSSARIANITDVIKEIASQTNLLALNAAIEAARAGESGRGFGVVAEEVKKLANNSEQSVKEISSMITVTRQNTTAVSKVIEDTTKAMHEAAAEAQEVVARFGDIMTAIQSSIQQVREIATQIDALTMTAGQIGAASEDVANSATSLAQMGLRE